MPESIGVTLKKIRESKRLSLEEVSERTRIPKKIISIIEEDRLREMESVFYAKEFVKSYSHFLGAVEEEAVKEYLSTGPKKDAPRLALKPENAAGAWLVKRKKYIGIALLVIFSVYAMILGFMQAAKLIKKASIRHAVVEAKPRPESGRGFASTTSEGVELMIEARYNTWIQVIGDNALLFRGALKKGTKDIWRAKKEINLEIGNAGGVTLTLNGKNLGSAGKRGEKRTIVVTEKGIQYN